MNTKPTKAQVKRLAVKRGLSFAQLDLENADLQGYDAIQQVVHEVPIADRSILPNRLITACERF